MINPHTSVHEAERRARRYWFVDGLPNLVAGLGFLAFALVLHYNRRDSGQPLSLAITIIALGLAVVILTGQRQIAEWLKVRITYPRTGYVTAPRDTENAAAPVDIVTLALSDTDAKREEVIRQVRQDHFRRTLLAVAFTACAMTAVALIKNPLVCVAAGFALCGAFWLADRGDRQISWLTLTALPLIGVYFALFSFSIVPRQRAAYFLAGMGALFVLEGMISLVQYLRQNPVLHS